MKKIISILLVNLMLLSCCIYADATDEKVFSFDKDGEFVILQISDPQDDQYPAPDMLRLIELSIEKTEPDLIIFTGDLVEDEMDGDYFVDGEWGREGVVVEGDYEKTLENVKTVCDAIFSIPEKAGIPFAIVMGNNDYKSGVTVEDWIKIFESYEYCIIDDESPDSSKRIDYNLELKSSDRTVFNLWLMDTGDLEITQEQLDWYKEESDALKEANGGEAVPSIWFQHVQTVDIGNLFEKCKAYNRGAIKVGEKYYRLNPDIATGYFEEIFGPGFTSDTFRAWKDQGDVLGAYFGHLHKEGYTGVYDSIEMGFTFGCQFSKDGPYGMRVFTIYEDDVRNYSSELYTYEGSVIRGNERLELQKGYLNDNIKTTRTVIEYIVRTVRVAYDTVKTIFTFIFN